MILFDPPLGNPPRGDLRLIVFDVQRTAALMVSDSCPGGVAGSVWLSDGFWRGADLAQVQAGFDCGAYVYARSDPYGKTPLHFAAANNEDPAVIQALLYFGANVHAKDDFGETPLDAAGAAGNAAVIDVLLSAAATTIAELLAPFDFSQLSDEEREMVEASLGDFGLDPAVISVEGSTVVVDGGFDLFFFTRFLRAVHGKEDDIKTVRIDSGGFINVEAMKLGNWMFDHSVDVVVENLCFSACANYVFTAGRNKTIMADSIVGWHGSEQQVEYQALVRGMPVREYMAQPAATMTDEEFEQGMLGIRIEQAFLHKIGVSKDALLYGLVPEHVHKNPQLEGATDIAGWTFSLEDMAEFGIDNVTYAGDGEYPPTDDEVTRIGSLRRRIVPMRVP